MDELRATSSEMSLGRLRNGQSNPKPSIVSVRWGCTDSAPLVPTPEHQSAPPHADQYKGSRTGTAGITGSAEPTLSLTSIGRRQPTQGILHAEASQELVARREGEEGLGHHVGRLQKWDNLKDWDILNPSTRL